MSTIKEQYELTQELASDVNDVIDSYMECQKPEQSGCVAALTVILAEVMTKFLIANDDPERSITILEKVMNDCLDRIYDGGKVEFRQNHGKRIPEETLN